MALATLACSNDPEFSLVVRGGMVFDGAGGPATAADVGIKGDRIAAIGDLGGRTTSAMIDATGKTVAPGFIDVNSDAGVSLLADGFAEADLRQGVTTEILGATTPAFWTATHADTAALRSRGLSLDWNGIDGYLRAVETLGTSVNVGTVVPLDAAPEGTATVAFLDRALGAGAFGVAADANSGADALAQAAGVVVRHDAILTVPVENAATQADDTLLALGAQAKRTAVDGLPRLTSTEAVIAVVRRMIVASERQTPIYGVAKLAAPGPPGDVVITAAKYGGVLLDPSLVRDAHTTVELREGIRRVTSMAASAFRIAQRGIVRENYFADLVIFDPAAAAGVDYVVVNGVPVLTPRGLTGSRPGYALQHGRPGR